MSQDFTTEERKVIYNAVRKWQMGVAVNGRTYQVCDDILKRIFDENLEEKTP
jgi:hypothetical protein